MPLTNSYVPGGSVGPSQAVFPVSANPGGAMLFVNSATGKDARSRVTFQGFAATTTQARNAQGPWNDPNFPLASVFGANGAISFCQAGRGDVIVVLPGHSEVIPNATFNVPAGVSVIGCGYGSARPTFGFAGTSTLINSNGAGVMFQNCIFDLTQVAALPLGFQIQHSGWQIVGCRIIQANATNQATQAIKLLAGADDFVMVNCDLDAETAGGTIGVGNPVTNNINRPYLYQNTIHGNFSTAAISLLSTGCIGVEVEGNVIRNNNATGYCLSLPTGNTFTGTFSFNSLYQGASSSPLFLQNGVSSALLWAQNFGYYAKGTTAYGAYLVPAVGT